MSFDAVVTNPGRLRILTALAVEERQEFVHLRRSTQLTDGNLASHARRLQSAGLVAIEKQFRAGKPVTSFELTAAGRTALESHVRRLLAAISHRRISTSGEAAALGAQSMTDEKDEAIAVAAAPTDGLSPLTDDWVD